MDRTPTHRNERDGARRGDRLFAEAGTILATSLDYREKLAAMAQLAVRFLADFCVIDVVEDREVRRLEVAHADRRRVGTAAQLLRFPLDRQHPHLSWQALETRKSVLISELSDARLDAMTQGPEHRRILRALDPRSLMAVPMLARDQLLGVIQFGSSRRRYDAADLALAERFVRLAALELDNARLYRDAQRALEARDRILRIVAHDLRNPLNVIGMSAELLLEQPLPEERRAQQLEVIRRSARRMNRLIQDLLDVARLEANRLLLQRTLEHPEELAREAVELSAVVATAKGVALRWTADLGLPRISADRDRLLQVLSNLIDNAVKFTPEGGRIEVRVERAEDAVRYAVADTGAGIPAAELPHLFEPFWQARRQSVEGAGLGLTIARGIVEAHGGRIWAESAPGRGSTFSFTVPAAQVPREGERREGPPDRRRAEGTELVAAEAEDDER